MRSFRSKPMGWQRDNYRHYLAAKYGAVQRYDADMDLAMQQPAMRPVKKSKTQELASELMHPFRRNKFTEKPEGAMENPAESKVEEVADVLVHARSTWDDLPPLDTPMSPPEVEEIDEEYYGGDAQQRE